jgi:short-subunit dehydrogenase
MNMKGTPKKIGLVTGANKGIGYEVVRQLAYSGCAVLLGARSLALGEEAAARLAAENLDVCYIPVDLDDSATIAAGK